MSGFRAWMLRETKDGPPRLEFERLELADLPEGEVLVEVHWSTVNYKDALAVTGKGKIARRFPMVPGIDLAGVVRESASPEYAVGDEVLLTGWGIGETHWGGYAEFARVKADWLLPVPPNLGMRGAMAGGPAGFTAAQAVRALQKADVAPGDRPVIVTGASGGVGSIAVLLLAREGYSVTALTGRPENADYLRRLGATDILPREELQGPGRPLESERWAGAVDAVGGEILARILAQTAHWGAVAACGLAGDSNLPTTVMPFILRGVSLLGIHSVRASDAVRRDAWDLLSRNLTPEILEEMTSEAGLEDIPRVAEEVLAGRVRGRTVVDVKR